ncbi:glycosyltransferase [Paenibacillus sp. NFR01]|uniref:glycosyltransferase family 2 protein n=1 Tax=Paenibacillus sp. NFR01 TaxID=1566279 RepID=UPI000B82328C|nr:glycosyltransferase [Paenibacillus sp. NFR01]
MMKILTSLKRIYYTCLAIAVRIKIKWFIPKQWLTGQSGYPRWIAKYEEPYARRNETFAYNPLISIVLPVYNVEESLLVECIQSVLDQDYPNWELCIADDHSTEPHIHTVLDDFSRRDARIHVLYRSENGHISACSNSALALASGEFVALLDNDDTLAPFALREIVRVINQNRGVDMMFSDEDKLEGGKRAFPFHKRFYGKPFLLHLNYICHLAVYRTSLIRQVGGFREGYEGVQDWDLALRVVQSTDNIVHIPRILYHWRISGNSTAGGEHKKDYIRQAKKKMLTDFHSKG